MKKDKPHVPWCKEILEKREFKKLMKAAKILRLSEKDTKKVIDDLSLIHFLFLMASIKDPNFKE